jgi:hypothetical protein
MFRIKWNITVPCIALHPDIVVKNDINAVNGEVFKYIYLKDYYSIILYIDPQKII